MTAAASQNARNKTRNTNTNKKTTNETAGKAKKKKQSATPTRGSARTRRESRSNNAAGKRRRKSPGIRVIRGRIHDSLNGNTCHQCRQKTIDFGVSCKNQIRDKQCALHFCHICLLNRYGEKAEEMAALGDWKCPKCRGICNCSLCMKKRGGCPTGRLAHVAKAAGFSSVYEMLQLENFDSVGEEACASPKCKTSPTDEGGVALMRKQRKENSFDGKTNCKSKHKSSGSDEKSEILTKNSTDNGSIKETEEIGRIHAGTLTESVHSFNKELAVASTRGCKRGRSCLDIKSDSELESKTLKLNEHEKEIPNGKLKRTRSVGLNDNVTDGNKGDTAFKKKTCLKRCQITREVPAGEEKACGRGDAIQSKKGRSNKQGLRKTHTRPYKIEDDTRKSNEDEATCKQVTGFHKRQKTAAVQSIGSDADISLPQGIELTNVADFDLPAEDVGHALQLLEFCEAFGKVLDLKKGQPGYLLQELACGRSSHGILQGSPIVGLHIKLLSMIQNGSGKEYVPLKTKGGNSWLLALKTFISESQDRSKELLSDCSNFATDEYGDLSPSMKLRLLNFLCDEALGTVELRRWIDEQNSEFAEEKKKSKAKLLAERKKERNMKMKLQDEMARANVMKNGPPLSISEQQDLVLKIKAEVSQTLEETSEAKYLEIKKKQRSHAVRLEPLLFDGNGRKFWNLRSYSGERDILLQDIRYAYGDTITSNERWFSYNIEEREVVKKYVLRQLGR